MLRKKVKATLLMLLTSVVPGEALAEYMTIRGISPEMSLDEVVSEIEERGGICLGNDIELACWSSVSMRENQEPPDMSILVQRDQFKQISFECSVLSICDLTFHQVMDALLESGIISDAKAMNFLDPGGRREDVSTIIASFRYTSPDGDFLSLVSGGICDCTRIFLVASVSRIQRPPDFD